MWGMAPRMRSPPARIGTSRSPRNAVLPTQAQCGKGRAFSGRLLARGALGRSAKEGTAVRTTKMMHGHLPTAARMAMWGGDKGGSVVCACGLWGSSVLEKIQ